ncbi:MAG: hypothetical protein AB7N54_19810 [Alphaproteobacteria bacterium]
MAAPRASIGSELRTLRQSMVDAVAAGRLDLDAFTAAMARLQALATRADLLEARVELADAGFELAPAAAPPAAGNVTTLDFTRRHGRRGE